MQSNTQSPHQSSEWQVPPGRYSAALTQVSQRSDEEIRLVFTLSKSCGLIGSKRAGKLYSEKRPIWLQKDLTSWLGTDRLQQLSADGHLGMYELSKLIGTQAVLEITNQGHGQSVPLSVIRAILPDTPGNLKMSNLGGPKFRMSFAPPASGHAIAA